MKFKSFTSKFLFYLFVIVPVFVLIQVPVFLAGVGLATYIVFSKDLPRIPPMESYQPKTVSTFYSDDGTVIGAFFKEKRFVVEQSQIPKHVINAFLAAEDARFFEHHGVDWYRVLGAVAQNVKALSIRSGGSTITMQVAKNFLLTRDRTFTRKIKEMILAGPLEKAWGKEKILHVYVNEIYLGASNYGDEAAARGFFGKPVEHLDIAEAALIAGLVASPSVFNPFKSRERARQRQLTVLGRMLKNGFITQTEYQEAKDRELVFKREVVTPLDLAPDFTEVVRRYVVKKYGEDKLYNEGLKVFTTCKLDYQKRAMESLTKGLDEIKSRHKDSAIFYLIPKEQIAETLEKRATPDLQESKPYQGVVTKIGKRNKDSVLQVALSNHLSGMVYVETNHPYKVGHVLAIRFKQLEGETPVFVLDTDTKLQGALVSIENKTGFVKALIGGSGGEHFQFNRATQAKRQPGSAFKPVIYATALEEKSYSPATIIIDNKIDLALSKEDPGESDWSPRNAGGDFLGPLPLRRALELSRNVCTIKILMDVGIEPVIKTAQRMGITSELGLFRSLGLGTAEVSLFEMTSAYTAFPNGGIHLEPVTVQWIEDRFGHVLEDNRKVPVLDESQIPRPRPREDYGDLIHEFDPPRPETPKGTVKGDKEQNKPQKEADAEIGPEPTGRAKPAMSPQTAYIMTSLLQGVVRQGTASRMGKYLKRKDLAGKTGTTNQATDTWFIGFNPDYTTGVWVGYDEKRPIGSREEGARAALPIWGYYMKDVLEGKPEKEFPVPPDITFKDVLTFVGTIEKGFTPKIVREPFYTPFVGNTLALSPIDPPEDLAWYKGITLQDLGLAQDGAAPEQPGPGVRGQSPKAAPIPLKPQEGKSFFPDLSTKPIPMPASAGPQNPKRQLERKRVSKPGVVNNLSR